MKACIIIIGFFGLMGCDPVKRAIKRKEVIDGAIAQWVAANPSRTDTVYLPGVERVRYDTIVYENIYSDTIRIKDTIYIRKVRYQDIIKTIMKTDTMYAIRSDVHGIQAIKTQLDRANGKLESKGKLVQQLGWALCVLSILCVGFVIVRFIR